MPQKHSKHPKPRLVDRAKLKGARGSDKKTTKQLPDTSRIPWFPVIPKTGTDA